MDIGLLLIFLTICFAIFLKRKAGKSNDGAYIVTDVVTLSQQELTIGKPQVAVKSQQYRRNYTNSSVARKYNDKGGQWLFNNEEQAEKYGFKKATKGTTFEEYDNSTSSSGCEASPKASQEVKVVYNSIKKCQRRKQKKLGSNVRVEKLSQKTNQQKKTVTFMDEESLARATAPPLRQYQKLNLSESALCLYLRHYLIDADLFRVLGFPIEDELSRVVIYRYQPIDFLRNIKRASNFDVNAREFVPSYQMSEGTTIIVNDNDGLDSSKEKRLSVGSNDDSGQGSGVSSPSVESETFETIAETGGDPISTVIVNQPSAEKTCIRCGRGFFITVDGEYLTQEHCVYHWGRLNRTFEDTKPNYRFSCCNGSAEAVGCTTHKLHVWSGLQDGFNGPFDGYVKTKPRQFDGESDQNPQIFALDCEMCFTGLGLELTKVTVVRCDGRLAYDTYVRPERDIIDYNTRFSGITEKDLCSKKGNTKSLRDVQNDLLQLFHADTILIGHAIENDLKALKMIHKTVIDTSISFPHFSGLPWRRSLKALTKSILKRDIQCSDAGHCSFEDARACLEIVLWKVRKDFRQTLEQK